MESFIIFILVGLVAGWLAGQIMKGGGFGLIGDIIVGVIGAVIGGWLWGALKLPGIGPWWLTSIIIATVGACILLFGGVRPVLELQRTRRQRPAARTDADQLAMLTGTPAGLWVAVFGMVALGALAVGALWLLG